MGVHHHGRDWIRVVDLLAGDLPAAGRAHACRHMSSRISGVIRPRKTSVAWAKVFPKRQTWAFAIGKFLTDPVWWFFLFWLPKFFNQQYGLTLDKMGCR